MWAFTFLYVLGLNIHQATGQDNSTQMYYAKLTIEETAIGNITALLSPFVSGTKLLVDNLAKTTICQNDSTTTVCTCERHYRWSDKVCKSKLKCCGNQTCIFPENSSRMCVSNASVMTGSITLAGLDYLECLAEHTSEEFKQCNNGLLEKIKRVYSTLKGFDTLTITEYKSGSVIADFEITFASSVNPHNLKNKSEYLARNLTASLRLETTGLVLFEMPKNPVCYNSQQNLKCTVQQELNTQAEWQLKRDGKVYDITDGTESKVTSTAKDTRIELTKISELWAGKYTCLYSEKSTLYTISHIASAVMNVSLLPNIDITPKPGFLLCQNHSASLDVMVTCAVDISNETYNVTWIEENIGTQVKSIKLGRPSEGKDLYVAQTAVRCDTNPHTIPKLTCTFKNSCNQTRTASTDINIIYANEKFCKAEGDWENTKAGFTAVLKCKDATGQRRRQCKKNGEQVEWEDEYAACVNEEVKNVLEKANIADIGLGSLDENSASVFSLLSNVTSNTQAIDTLPNMNASVHVLVSLSEKLKQINNESAVDDLLLSSSNLLEKSLEEAWKAKSDKDNQSISLAEIYLSSVEHLIEVTNIKNVTKKKNLEVAATNCTETAECSNTVFNVFVKLGSSERGSVKTAGFKELEEYLPNKNDSYTPNSIVVSTTTERKSNSVEIEINFPLLKPRRRNVKITCVSWDNNTRSWSSFGCEWAGPSNEGRCICSHLSSFAILMSKYPLEVPGLTVITYIGLSVSVMSLIISLVIELMVWNAVVKTNTLYLRHTAHVNISLCLLVADCCFLASSKPHHISEIWCKTFVVLKQFCYLSMFFWMLCLSSTLLHQAIFLFHSVSKKSYLRFSLVLGYGCPFLIVAITFLANKGGAEGLYFSRDTCWLVYSGLLKGSIYTFLIPVGIIVFLNVFSMLVVIMKLLDHPKNTEKSLEKEKKAALTVMRSVILLTPVFGVTWIFGFAVIFLDLTSGDMAYMVNYAFNLLNAFQGLFILLTTCLGDQLTRDALRNHLKNSALPSTSDSTANSDSTWKK